MRARARECLDASEAVATNGQGGVCNRRAAIVATAVPVAATAAAPDIAHARVAVVMPQAGVAVVAAAAAVIVVAPALPVGLAVPRVVVRVALARAELTEKGVGGDGHRGHNRPAKPAVKERLLDGAGARVFWQKRRRGPSGVSAPITKLWRVLVSNQSDCFPKLVNLL